MWSTIRNNSRAQTEECNHAQRIETTFAGLGRAVCEACGHVSVSYQYNLFEEERRQHQETRDEQARELRRKIVKRQE